jgi:polyribonucleotide nucleotidyltransferase
VLHNFISDSQRIDDTDFRDLTQFDITVPKVPAYHSAEINTNGREQMLELRDKLATLMWDQYLVYKARTDL